MANFAQGLYPIYVTFGGKKVLLRSAVNSRIDMRPGGRLHLGDVTALSI